MAFNGLGVHMGNLSRLSAAESRSISPENFTGEKGGGARATDGTGAQCARDLGHGWKISPSVRIGPGETFELADIEGSGAIQHIWMTPRGVWRDGILRCYWDGQEQPSVECPMGDFFACGWGQYAQVSSLAVCVNPARAFNCYWEMPFHSSARITMTNIGPEEMILYYQVSYTLTEVPAECACFHAQFRRVNPLPYKEVHRILDGVVGQGHYVGTYLAWGVNNTGWWGEGEIKFYLDGDGEFPTICGTGTEDYFCGSYGFPAVYSTAYVGNTLKHPGENGPPKWSLYRWHIQDPICFQQDLRVTIQALGWWPNGTYQPLADDIASVAYWYQAEPHAAFPTLPVLKDRWPR